MSKLCQQEDFLNSMRIRIPIIRKARDERGVALIVVLIIASVFAVLAYTALAVSIKSLENTDTHRNIIASRQTAESAVNDAAYRLLVDPDSGDAPGYIDPAYAKSVAENNLKAALIDASFSTPFQTDSSPTTFEHMAYTTDTSLSTASPDTDVVPGNRDNATYSYLDDTTFSQNYPAYEFAPVRNTGDMTIYGAGEVRKPEGDQTLFSFVRGDYPNVQWNYDMREAGVTEPSRLGPYPLIQTQHPYGNNESRNWAVTYMNDPAHTGRHLTGIALIANNNEVQIDAGDSLFVTPWIEANKRFQLPPAETFTGYTNGATQVFTNFYDTSTLALYFQSDANPPTPGMDYGFNISGVRYKFDSDHTPVFYETPHPYDDIIQQTDALNLNMQVIYAPYQAESSSAEVFTQQMTIQFDPQGSLDAGDRLFLFNASDPSAATNVAMYTSANFPPPGGYSPAIFRIDPNLPLGFIILMDRAGSGDTDGTLNYGYKVMGMEYTNINRDWARVENPIMQSPHNLYLGATSAPFNIPALGMSFTPPIGLNLAGFQTIYKPAVPDKSAPNGQGSVDAWFVSFSDACDMTASSGLANSDYIRLTTPGNSLVGGFDTIYFVHPNGSHGFQIGADPQYFDIVELKNYIVDCGTADLLEIEFMSDSNDAYEPTLQNFGYLVAQIGYTTSNGLEDDRTPPTIRSDMNFPKNTSYPSFGSAPDQSPEWWYSNPTALIVGLHFDRTTFDLDPGDRIEIYDETGALIASVLSDSISGGPDSGGPINPDQPGGGSQPGQGPGAGGPFVPDGTVANTIVDLNATYGWVLIPGKTARIRFVGDGDNNEGYTGFEIDHCGFVDGDITQIHNYANEYAAVAYDKYYDRSAEPLERFRTLGSE
jgi:hypothetical protein